MHKVIVVCLLMVATAFASPPPNDDCPTATEVTSVPFVDYVDTTFAKPESVDFLSCGPGGGPTVWYRIVPPHTGTFCARTCGSDYDTVIGMGRSGCGGTYEECSDDACDFQSEIGFDAIAGGPVWFQVGAYEFFPRPARGGPLVFTVLDAAADSDGDGVLDCEDNCESVANPTQTDSEFDGVGNACDPCSGYGGDADADGVCGLVDRCRAVSDPAQLDTDGDWAGNVCDMCPGVGGADADLDGICDDVADNCLGLGNPSQTDADGDGVGDACDGCSGPGATDGDGDGVCDDDRDNCPGDVNPDQEDEDADDIGDACDTCPGIVGGGALDADGDGHPDDCDACPGDPSDACATVWGCLTPYDYDLASRLVRIDPVTARTTIVGSLGTGGCGGLAFEPGTGRLLAVAASVVEAYTFDLFEVDPTTAGITRIGSIGEYEGVGLAFRSDGALFATVDGAATRIDPTTGALIPLSSPNVTGYTGGLVFDGGGTLVFVDGGVWSVDQTTGVSTSYGYLDEYPLPGYIDAVRGIAFDGQAFYVAWVADIAYDPVSTFGVTDVQPGANQLTAMRVAPRDLAALTAQVCGNGTIEGGEDCDDGNTVSGDCCSPTCLAEAPGSPCAGDASVCTVDACDGLGACTHTVPAVVGCATATSTRATLSMTPGSNAKLAWSWRGTATDVATFGTPDTSVGLTLCLGGADGGLLMESHAPAGGLCQGQACWRPKSSGWDYVDHDRTPDGIDKILLRANPLAGKARVKIKAQQPNLVLPSLPASPPLRVRLVRDDGAACWDATYSTPTRNDSGGFKGRSD